jgi:hypothetical protein
MQRLRIPVVIAVFLLAGLIPISTVLATNTPAEQDANAGVDMAALYQLQASFHRAATGHNPDGLDSDAVRAQRVGDMLSLWTDDGSLTLNAVSPARVFSGKGDPGSDSCTAGSNTLCDFFSNVSPSFEAEARAVSMTPAFKTQFAVDGDSASVYFECHYFDAASWHDMSHLNLNGSAKKVDGHWLLAQADVTTAGVPYP